MTQKPDQWFDSSVIFRVFRPTPRAARKRANEQPVNGWRGQVRRMSAMRMLLYKWAIFYTV
jgi:hypothetical protein